VFPCPKQTCDGQHGQCVPKTDHPQTHHVSQLWLMLWRAGLRLIQLLPVNDTSVYNMWWDSYPYSSVSVGYYFPLVQCWPLTWHTCLFLTCHDFCI
jgi:hypothetical protein